MYIICKLICEWASEKLKNDILHLLIVSIPKLGRKSINKDPWYIVIQKNFITISTDEYGMITHKLCRTLHNDNGPAIIRKHGTWLTPNEEWYRYGLKHRLNKPAVISKDYKVWYKNGLIHNKNGPAYIGIDRVDYYIDGKLHRVNGPARVIKYGGKVIVQEWWLNGLRHRTNGPAIIRTQQLSYSKEPQEQWCENGVLHRVNGPAVTYFNGTKKWYIHGIQTNL